MNEGDMVRRAFYSSKAPTFLEEDLLGLIIDVFKPSGHRRHRCIVLWSNGETTEQSIDVLRRFDESR